MRQCPSRRSCRRHRPRGSRHWAAAAAAAHRPYHASVLIYQDWQKPRPHGGGELPSPGLAAAGPKNSPKSPSESLSEGSKQGPSFSRRMRLSPGLSPLNRFVSGNPLRMIPSIHLPVSLRSSGTRPADGAREQPYESASEEAAHAGVATTADQGAGVGLAQPPSWRATTMVLASEFDLQPGAQRVS